MGVARGAGLFERAWPVQGPADQQPVEFVTLKEYLDKYGAGPQQTVTLRMDDWDKSLTWGLGGDQVRNMDRKEPVRLVVQAPVNASFSINVRIQTGDADAGIAAPFARCAPNGCFVDFDIRDDVLKKFRTATGAGKLSFADAGGHDVSVPLSFNGFNQAVDALLKE